MPEKKSPPKTAAPLVPSQPTLPKLREAAAKWTACDLHERGTQTVFGEGSRRSGVIFVGEQQALLGKGFKVTQMRGTFVRSELARFATATVHPSSLLRAPDEESRRREYRALVEDLKKIAAVIDEE